MKIRDNVSRDYLLSLANKDGTYCVHYVSAHKIINAPPVKEITEKDEQNIAIKYCHDHNLLMIPVDLYHELNVTYNAYMNNMTYEEAEKLLLEVESEDKDG